MSTRITIAVSLGFLLVACGEAVSEDQPSQEGLQPQEAAASFDDPEVARIHDRMMSVIAPDGGWERARYLEFEWAVVGGTARRHHWDRWEGAARVEAPVDGQRMVAIFNTSNPAGGRVWLDGEELTGEDAEERLQQAYRNHINDAYWLLMPFKWDDPGVSARYLGEEVDGDGREWEVVELAFDDGTGLTPQNRYHAFVNPETGRMELWHYYSTADADPSPSHWTDWRRVGPIELAENRRPEGVDADPRIHFPHLRVETEPPEGAFDPPAS